MVHNQLCQHTCVHNPLLSLPLQHCKRSLVMQDGHCATSTIVHVPLAQAPKTPRTAPQTPAAVATPQEVKDLRYTPHAACMACKCQQSRTLCAVPDGRMEPQQDTCLLTSHCLVMNDRQPGCFILATHVCITELDVITHSAICPAPPGVHASSL